MNFSTQEDGRKKTFNEINITPLTDIFLVLLIIMMVIAPSFQSINNNIEMPKITSGSSVEVQNSTVSITKDGSFFLGDKKIASENLEADLSKIIGSLEEKKLMVKADKETKSSEIMKVMKAAQSAGFEKLIVAGEPLSQQRQEELTESKVNLPPQEDEQ